MTMPAPNNGAAESLPLEMLGAQTSYPPVISIFFLGPWKITWAVNTYKTQKDVKEATRQLQKQKPDTFADAGF